jgi:hypothetical protein
LSEAWVISSPDSVTVAAQVVVPAWLLPYVIEHSGSPG